MSPISDLAEPGGEGGRGVKARCNNVWGEKTPIRNLGPQRCCVGGPLCFSVLCKSSVERCWTLRLMLLLLQSDQYIGVLPFRHHHVGDDELVGSLDMRACVGKWVESDGAITLSARPVLFGRHA